MRLWLLPGVSVSWPFVIDLQKCLCSEDLIMDSSTGNTGVSKARGLKS